MHERKQVSTFIGGVCANHWGCPCSSCRCTGQAPPRMTPGLVRCHSPETASRRSVLSTDGTVEDAAYAACRVASIRARPRGLLRNGKHYIDCKSSTQQLSHTCHATDTCFFWGGGYAALSHTALSHSLPPLLPHLISWYVDALLGMLLSSPSLGRHVAVASYKA